MRYLLFCFLLGGCASFDVDAVKRIVKDRKVNLIEVDKDTNVVIRRDRECHCAMLKLELKF